MAVSSLVAASGGKTMYRTTLTSGTSWTVPAGVTYVNVTLTAGGGGGGGFNSNSNGTTPTSGSAGGNTTFTGATTATGGNGGFYCFNDAGSTNFTGFQTKKDAAANSGESGGAGCGINSLGGTTGAYAQAGEGQKGVVVSSTLSTTPGASIAYAIGAGGAGGQGNTYGGANGGSGKIDIEYWV